MKVVMLLGPSSAGKSTICGELQKTHGYRVASGDDTMEKLHEEARGKLHEHLSKVGLSAQLAAYMTPKEIEAVCFTGVLNICKGNHPVKDFHFSSPEYIEAQDCLTKAGFVDPELTQLADALHAVGNFYRNYPLPDLTERLFDQAFDPSLKDDDCIVIDIVPESSVEETNKLIARYQERAQDFENKTGRKVEAITVMAYSPPEELSKRVLKRNEEARAAQNLGNLREGTFPFMQLSNVVTAKPSSRSRDNSLGQVSRSGVMSIAYQHRRPTQDPLISKDKSIQKFQKATKQLIKDYRELSQSFGLMSGVESAELALPAGMKVDKVINTSQGTPQELAEQVNTATKTNAATGKNKL